MGALNRIGIGEVASQEVGWYDKGEVSGTSRREVARLEVGWGGGGDEVDGVG